MLCEDEATLSSYTRPKTFSSLKDSKMQIQIACYKDKILHILISFRIKTTFETNGIKTNVFKH